MEKPDYEYIPLRQYKGTCIFSSCEIEEIEKLEVRDDDIWVLSYPRSGTTLTQEIVYLLTTKLDFSTARSRNIDDRFPFLDLYLQDFEFFQGVRHAVKQQSPRLFKSHLHYHLLPEQLFTSPCKKIYVMRNPKDVFISHTMLTKFFKQVPPDTDESVILDEWISTQRYASPWWLHVHDFWLHKNDPNLLILTYEQIVKDLGSAVRKVAAHLSVDVTEDQVSQIVDYCSFDNMKLNNAVNSSWQEDFRKVDKQFGGHIRKGKIGGWKNHFTQEMSQKLDDHVQQKLGHLDIVFDYGM